MSSSAKMYQTQRPYTRNENPTSTTIAAIAASGMSGKYGVETLTNIEAVHTIAITTPSMARYSWCAIVTRAKQTEQNNSRQSKDHTLGGNISKHTHTHTHEHTLESTADKMARSNSIKTHLLWLITNQWTNQRHSILRQWS